MQRAAHYRTLINAQRRGKYKEPASSVLGEGHTRRFKSEGRFEVGIRCKLLEHRPYFSEVGQVPESGGFVVAGAGEQPAVRREGDRCDASPMTA